MTLKPKNILGVVRITTDPPPISSPPNTPPPHDLENVRRLRRDIEALLWTYPEVLEVWPQSKSALWAKLDDGRIVTVDITLGPPPT